MSSRRIIFYGLIAMIAGFLLSGGIAAGRLSHHRQGGRVVFPTASRTTTSQPGVSGDSDHVPMRQDSEGIADGKENPSLAKTVRAAELDGVSARPTSSPQERPLVAASPIDALPSQSVSNLPADELKNSVGRGSSAKCINRGMQQKCLFQNLAVKNNQFFVYGNRIDPHSYPNPIFPPDGQNQPLIKHHNYRGHPIKALGNNFEGAAPCTRVVDRPVVFLYRMSGHSTYHLWENNLGPFFATLQESFDDPQLAKAMNDPKQLLVSFVDLKPTVGPKAPHLLDQLLATFTDIPLINASRIGEMTCFSKAVVGISANSFQHRALLYRMMDNIVGYSPPPPLPEQPNAIFISRNHKSVVRGRKIANEAEVLEALNATVLNMTGKPLIKVHMEDLKYREQVALAMKSNIIFSPHGGGVANCIWMRRGSIMVEFVAPVGKTLPNMYHSMCGKSAVSHFHFLAEPDPADAGVKMDNPRLFSNMLIPPERMVANGVKAIELYRANRAKEAKKGV